jgi:enolase
VQKAVSNANSLISNAIVGMEVSGQREIDAAMIRLDGTKNKSRLGANAMVAVSLAAAQCAANEAGSGLYRMIGKKPSVPAPMMNVINGGKHAGSGIAIQEFMVYPLGFPTFSEALCAGVEIYHSLKTLVSKKYGAQSTGLGDEGGFAPPCKSTRDALSLLESAIAEAGYGKEVKLAIDAASSSFYDLKSKKYFVDGKNIPAGELSDLYVSLSKEYPIVSLEDPFDEESFRDFALLRKRLLGKVQIVGDDLTVTSMPRLIEAKKSDSISALLLKVNQVGTLSEALDAASYCRKNGLGVVVSHRSGETTDTAISDIASGLGCGQIKTGAPCRGERTAKYNRLLAIESELGKGSFFGAKGITLG